MLVGIVGKNNMNCQLYCADKIVYIYNNQVTTYCGRPVLKVELVERKEGKVTFLTDWPVEKITLDESLFNKHFHRW